jgi:hypothetical protein
MFSSNLLFVRNRRDKMTVCEGADFSMAIAGTTPMPCAFCNAACALPCAACAAPPAVPDVSDLSIFTLTR